MKKVLKIGCGVLVAIPVLLCLIGLFLPTKWHVERSIVIPTGPEAFHPLVDTPKDWKLWAAWSEADPTLTYEFEGPESGVGAVMRWKGDSGFGRLAITRSEPDVGVWFDLAIEQDEVNARGVISYEAQDGGTKVTWADDGDVGMKPIGGYFVGFLETALGEHFQIALENLKAEAQKRTAEPPAPQEAEGQ